MMESRPLAVFSGSSSATNVRLDLNDIMSFVPGDKHLISTNSEFKRLEGFEVFGTNFPNTIVGEIKSLNQYFHSHSPRLLLQITNPPVHGTIVGLLARRFDVPFVYRYSGDRFYEYRVSEGRNRFIAFVLGSLLGRIPIRLAQRFIVLGPTGKRRLIARGVPSEQISILPHSVDPARFENLDPVSLKIPNNRKQILFVGRVSHLKGADTLEDVIPKVLERRDDLQFVCVGSGGKNLSIPEKYRNHVTKVGKVSSEIVPDYMAAADLLIHPSLSEGVPHVLLESIAAGTPVLARDVGDVATVTGNTFQSDEELVKKIASFESIPLDDISSFLPYQLKPAYRDFFKDR